MLDERAILDLFVDVEELIHPPGDRPPRVVRRDLAPGYTGPTHWRHGPRVLPRLRRAPYIESTGETIVADEWVELPGPEPSGPLTGQGRDWKAEAHAAYWKLRDRAGGMAPTQIAVAVELGTNDRYLYEVLGPWRVFAKHAEATPPNRS